MTDTWFAFFEQHTTILRGVGDLLRDADRLMAQRGWASAHTYNNVGTETSLVFDAPEKWVPGWFVRYYQNENHPVARPYVAVFLHDRGGTEDYPSREARLETPLIIAGVSTFVEPTSKLHYWICKSFFWAGGQPDGTVVTEDFGAQGGRGYQRRNASFARQLTEITSFEALESRIVEPLVALIRSDENQVEPKVVTTTGRSET